MFLGEIDGILRSAFSIPLLKFLVTITVSKLGIVYHLHWKFPRPISTFRTDKPLKQRYPQLYKDDVLTPCRQEFTYRTLFENAYNSTS